MNLFGIGMNPYGATPPSGDADLVQRVAKHGDLLLEELDRASTDLEQARHQADPSQILHHTLSNVLQTYSGFQEAVKDLAKSSHKYSPLAADLQSLYIRKLQPLIVASPSQLSEHGLDAMGDQLKSVADDFRSAFNALDQL